MRARGSIFAYRVLSDRRSLRRRMVRVHLQIPAGWQQKGGRVTRLRQTVIDAEAPIRDPFIMRLEALGILTFHRLSREQQDGVYLAFHKAQKDIIEQYKASNRLGARITRFITGVTQNLQRRLSLRRHLAAWRRLAHPHGSTRKSRGR
jgi:hypothetical protein